MNITKFTITKRLWILTALLLVNIATVGFISAWNASLLVSRNHDVVEVNMPAMQNLGLVEMMCDKLRTLVYQAALVTNGQEVGDLASIRSDFEETSGKVFIHLVKIARLGLGSKTSEAIDQAKPTLEEFMNASTKILDLFTRGDRAKGLEQLAALQSTFEKLKADLGVTSKLIEDHVTRDKEVGDALAKRSNILSILLVMVGIITGLGTSFWLIRHIINTMSQITNSLDDEARKLAASSTQTHVASNQLTHSTNEQSAAIEETAASMEEMTSMISQTAQNAERMLGEAEAGREEIQKGKTVVLRVVNAMQGIHTSNDKLKNIVRLIDDIKAKTKVINDIASETRLLSFNASIEAARAGRHGKGFAVVAEEVGKLAVVSNKAADEIRTVLESSLIEVTEIVADTREKVATGHEVSRECEEVFGRMGETLSRISKAVQLVTAASKEQAIGVKQATNAMNDMEKFTQRNSRSAEEMSGSAQALSQSALLIEQNVQRMRSFVFGHAKVNGTNGPVEGPSAGPGAALVNHPSLSRAADTLADPKSTASADGSQSAAAGGVDEKVDRSDSRWRAA